MSQVLNMQRVAEAAGVSKSSVSLALRDDPRLAAATRRRVQEIAARMGYRKNPIVASLMSQLRISQTPRFHSTIALINCSSSRTLIDEAGFAEYRDGIRAGADKSGYGVEEFWAADPAVKLVRLRQILTTRNIRGLILAIPFDGPVILAGQRDFFRSFSVASVGFDRSEPLLPRAASNHFETVRAAVQHVIALGYERPGIVLLDAADRLLKRRYSSGYRAGMHDAERVIDGSPAPLLLDSMNRGQLAAWMETEKPDVILTDLIEVRTWLLDLHRRVPEEIGIVHLNWTGRLTEWAGMNQNGTLVGAAAAELVINQMAQNEVGVHPHPKLVMVESDFVAGPSVRRGLMRRPAAPSVAAR